MSVCGCVTGSVRGVFFVEFVCSHRVWVPSGCSGLHPPYRHIVFFWDRSAGDSTLVLVWMWVVSGCLSSLPCHELLTHPGYTPTSHPKGSLDLLRAWPHMGESDNVIQQQFWVMMAESIHSYSIWCYLIIILLTTLQLIGPRTLRCVGKKGSNTLDFILVLVVVFSFALVHFLQFLSIFTFVKVYASV